MVRDSPKAKTWGRRPYADKEARELLNDRSRRIARDPPDHVDDPARPKLSDVLKTNICGADGDDDAKATTLTAMMKMDMTFQEAVIWYWYRHAQFSLTEIQFAIDGIEQGGDPVYREQSKRNIIRVLKSAAAKDPDADPDTDVPDMNDILDDQADTDTDP